MTTTSSVVTARSGTVREVVSFSAPLVVSNLSQSVMWIVDTAILGRVGTVEQGAAGLGGVLWWAMLCFFTGTMTVVNILVAQDHGAGRKDLSRHVNAGVALILPMCLAIAPLWFAVPHALGWMGASAEVRPFATIYLQIRLLSSPFTLGTFVLASFLRGLGDTVTPMIASVIANVSNALLAVVLVFGLAGLPRLGVEGAAIATAIAGAIECSYCVVIYLCGRRAIQAGSRSWSSPGLWQLRRFLTLGAPIGLSWMFEMVGWTAFAAYAATRAPAELAAHTVLFQVTSFCFMPAAALGVTASTLVGQYLGARRPDLASRSAWLSIGIGVGYMTIVGIAIALFRTPLVRAFNPDPAVVALGSAIGLLAGAYQPFDGFGIVAQSVIRGSGRTSTPTYVMLGSGFFVFLPLVWVLGEGAHLGVRGAWGAAVIHVTVVALVIGVLVLRGKWRDAPVLIGADRTPRPV